MKQFICLFICTTSLLSDDYCQPVVTDANNKRIMEWDSSYTVETKMFLDIYYQYAVKKENKLVADYLRHDDSSYLFVSYDSSGKQNQRGLLKLVNEHFECDSIVIPDFKKDPYGNIFYDTILCNSSYRKNYFWKETDSNGMVWRGMYENGLREGEWEEGTYLKINSPEGYIIERLHDYFIPYVKHTFRNGIEISKYRDSIFWPKIKGKWYLHTSLNNTTVMLRRSGIRLIYNFKLATQISYPERSSECSDCFNEWFFGKSSGIG